MAIAVENVYNSLLTLIREDKRGLALSPDEYNRMAAIVNERVYQKALTEFETSTKNIESLAKFKVLNTELVLVAGATSLPSDYYQMIGKPRVNPPLGSTRRCDLVSQLEYNERYEDYLTQPSYQYPVYTIGGVDGSDNLIMHVYPTTITGSVYIDYLKTADVPYYDYYVNDSTAVITYMDVGDTITIPLGSTYRDRTVGDGATTFASISVDWEWDDEDLQLILILFCQLMGIAYPEQFLTEVSNLEETKQKER